MTRRSWLLMALLASLWGASYLFIKVALEDVAPTVLVFARTALGALVLAPVAVRTGALRGLRPKLGSLVLLAVLQIAGPFLLISVGEQHVSSSLAGILVSAAPIWTALLALRMDAAERSHGWGLVGVIVGIAGVALLFGVDLSTDTAALLGGLAIVLAALGYAAGALVLKRRMAGVPAVGIATATIGISALLLLPTVPFAVPEGAGLDTMGALAALGAGGTGLAFLVFYTLIAEVGPARASVVAYIAPVFSIGYGATLLDESLSAGTVAGLVLILAGSFLAAERRLPWQPRRARVAPQDLAGPAPIARSAA